MQFEWGDTLCHFQTLVTGIIVSTHLANLVYLSIMLCLSDIRSFFSLYIITHRVVLLFS